MKEDYRQLSNILLNTGLLLAITAGILQYAVSLPENFPLQLFWLGALALVAAGLTIKFIYSTHHQM